MNLKATLTRKYGGLPGWAWAGIAGVGAWLLLPRLMPKSSGPAAGTATPQNATQIAPGYPGFSLPGQQPPAPVTPPTPIPTPVLPPAPPTPGPAPAPTPVTGPGAGLVPVFWRNPLNGAIYLVNSTGKRWINPVEWASLSSQGYTYSNVDPAQINALPDMPGWTPLPARPPLAHAGGPAAIGSRSAQLMTHFHPALKQPVTRPHWVRSRAGVGGANAGAAHANEVSRVASQAGLHPARLMMLNPHPNGWIRVA